MGGTDVKAFGQIWYAHWLNVFVVCDSHIEYALIHLFIPTMRMHWIQMMCIIICHVSTQSQRDRASLINIRHIAFKMLGAAIAFVCDTQSMFSDNADTALGIVNGTRATDIIQAAVDALPYAIAGVAPMGDDDANTGCGGAISPIYVGERMQLECRTPIVNPATMCGIGLGRLVGGSDEWGADGMEDHDERWCYGNRLGAVLSGCMPRLNPSVIGFCEISAILTKDATHERAWSIASDFLCIVEDCILPSYAPWAWFCMSCGTHNSIVDAAGDPQRGVQKWDSAVGALTNPDLHKAFQSVFCEPFCEMMASINNIADLVIYCMAKVMLAQREGQNIDNTISTARTVCRTMHADIHMRIGASCLRAVLAVAPTAVRRALQVSTTTGLGAPPIPLDLWRVDDLAVLARHDVCGCISRAIQSGVPTAPGATPRGSICHCNEFQFEHSDASPLYIDVRALDRVRTELRTILTSIGIDAGPVDRMLGMCRFAGHVNERVSEIRAAHDEAAGIANTIMATPCADKRCYKTEKIAPDGRPTTRVCRTCKDKSAALHTALKRKTSFCEATELSIGFHPVDTAAIYSRRLFALIGLQCTWLASVTCGAPVYRLASVLGHDRPLDILDTMTVLMPSFRSVIEKARNAPVDSQAACSAIASVATIIFIGVAYDNAFDALNIYPLDTECVFGKPLTPTRIARHICLYCTDFVSHFGVVSSTPHGDNVYTDVIRIVKRAFYECTVRFAFITGGIIRPSTGDFLSGKVPQDKRTCAAARTVADMCEATETYIIENLASDEEDDGDDDDEDAFYTGDSDTDMVCTAPDSSAAAPETTHHQSCNPVQ
jgi:hypothetical protein